MSEPTREELLAIVARVEALADEWQRRSDRFTDDGARDDYAYFDALSECSADLRAALAPAPSGTTGGDA